MLNILPDDVGFLSIEYADQWEELTENSKTGLLIHNYTLVDGYTPEQSDLMLLIPSTYPTASIDMFYFSPPVQRSDGVQIVNLAVENHFGISWQRWSRHYQWNPSVDDVGTHMARIGNILLYELQKQ